jgi:AcrR family transcriptional regulator
MSRQVFGARFATVVSRGTVAGMPLTIPPSRARGARRQRREEIRAAVRDATINLIRDGVPFSELTVEELAKSAGLSRSAFYLYFRDKQDIVVQALDEAAREIEPIADRFWRGDGDPAALVREAVEGIVAAYERNADLLGLAAELAGSDADLRAIYDGILDQLIRRTAEHLAEEVANGRLRPIDPEATAELLVWSAERACYAGLARGRRTPAELTDALAAVWTAALYPDDVAASSG